MKWVMIVPDGMADWALPELDGQTPLMKARTPAMDRLAREAILGKVLTVPEGMYPGSDVANMALLGYDPRQHYTGRGPIEAAAMGVELEPTDVAFRCSLISTDGERLLDYSGGNISTEEAHTLIQLLQEKLGTSKITFFPGVGYRHVMRWRGGPVEAVCVPPHEIVGSYLRDYYPQGDGEQTLIQLMEDSYEILSAHPINRRREDEGKLPANMIWLWGQGRAPKLEPFSLKWGKTGAVIAAVDVIRGLGRLAGLETPTVPGATGYIDTNYAGKGEYALRMLEKHDFVYVHIEAPDEAGHHGDVEAKIWAIEQIDKHIVAQIAEGLFARKEPFRMLIVPDHFTPVAKRTHAEGFVPFLLYDSRQPHPSRFLYDESILEEPNLPTIEEGYRLIETLLEA
ncbi:MAG: cofactor-independent phosphoglycerate mutase [Fimbriimonadales bacterium]|jgi:2,3-bisphosphoglycerate-independent phosphoglycerate mutase|nr:cofactor-independent phosphoglycerate mutase [Fimbriimonadales bacterium]GIV12644.1 MAG: homoserine kinase [Fimbriimonadales bacterium]CUU09741.1 phosphoglycerate mutase [Armatimonadetes bacterium GBS]